jgi:hypothetical protein
MPAPSLIGAPKTAVDTPALLVDLDVMEANIGHVVEICRTNGIGWRPHTKGQKTPKIIQFDGLKWLSGVYLPRVFGSKAELPPNDDSDVLAVERKREMRRAILAELNSLAVPEPLTIDEDGQES